MFRLMAEEAIRDEDENEDNGTTGHSEQEGVECRESESLEDQTIELWHVSTGVTVFTHSNVYIQW